MSSVAPRPTGVLSQVGSSADEVTARLEAAHSAALTRARRQHLEIVESGDGEGDRARARR